MLRSRLLQSAAVLEDRKNLASVGWTSYLSYDVPSIFGSVAEFAAGHAGAQAVVADRD